MIVIDASAVVDMLADRSASGAQVRARLAADPRVAAPDMMKFEVMSGLRGMVIRREISERDAAHAVARLAGLVVASLPTHLLLGRIWELRRNLTPYDAAYVAAAEIAGATLVTRDAAMVNAPGIRCAVELVGA